MEHSRLLPDLNNKIKINPSSELENRSLQRFEISDNKRKQRLNTQSQQTISGITWLAAKVLPLGKDLVNGLNFTEPLSPNRVPQFSGICKCNDISMASASKNARSTMTLFPQHSINYHQNMLLIDSASDHCLTKSKLINRNK